MNIKIDEHAGFCRGVLETVEITERLIKENPNHRVNVLGEIIHNPLEISRLEKKGMHTITHKDFNNIIDKKNDTIIIRAHGEPPATFETAKKLGLKIVDGTCPRVKTLQRMVYQHCEDDYHIIIFGKHQHPEVIGLRGVCDDECTVIQTIEEAESLHFKSKKVVLISQTTMKHSELFTIKDALTKHINKLNMNKSDIDFKFIDTTCSSVVNRESSLIDFSKSCDIVIFVSGKNSSNGNALYKTAKSANTNSHFIENINELDWNWFKSIDTVGISGATSTPSWYMEKVKSAISEHFA